MYRLVFMMLGILAVCEACTSPPDAYRVGEQEPASPTQAGFEEGQVAYGRGDYATAYKVWLPLARQGHASAQGTLGFLYKTGQGVRQDHAEAAKWYRKAAEQGNAEAQYNLGNSYRKGQGVPQDYNEAFKWIRMAAEQGYFDAYNNLVSQTRASVPGADGGPIEIWRPAPPPTGS